MHEEVCFESFFYYLVSFVWKVFYLESCVFGKCFISKAVCLESLLFRKLFVCRAICLSVDLFIKSVPMSFVWIQKSLYK